MSGIKIVTLNARSVKNKDHYIMDCIKNFGWDLTVITETWLTENDQIWIDASELCKYRNKILMKNRIGKRGGITLIFRLTLNVKWIDQQQSWEIFEYCEWSIKAKASQPIFMDFTDPPPAMT